MIVMTANNSDALVHYLAGKYPGSVGWLFSPGGFKEPRRWMPYALDNGRFIVRTRDDEHKWSEDKFFGLLDRCRLSRYKPIWVAVPDQIGSYHCTESMWHKYESRLREYGWPLAYVVQDGCDPDRVPKRADVIFVGGTTSWKWQNAKRFCDHFPRVHVGRVNWVDKLEYCEEIGVESCDGTGWFREGADGTQGRQLQKFISGHRVKHPELFPTEV